MLTIGKTVQHVRRSDEDDDADWSLRIPIPPSPAHYQSNNNCVRIWLVSINRDGHNKEIQKLICWFNWIR